MSKFILPEGILDQHLVVLGKTGSGKSSALRYVVEHLLDDSATIAKIFACRGSRPDLADSIAFAGSIGSAACTARSAKTSGRSRAAG